MRVAILSTICAVMLVGCADNTSHHQQVYDPIEPVNRSVFAVNQVVDTYALEPLAKGYRHIPQELRIGIRNFLRNINEPFSTANQLLQADFAGAANGTGRFFINTTLGMGGVMDVAALEFNMPHQGEDLGQTLAVWGVPDGPYIVLPLMGASNARDTVGFIGGIILDPVDYVVDDNTVTISTISLTVLDRREQLIEPIARIKAESFDYYSSTRSISKQRRDKEIEE